MDTTAATFCLIRAIIRKPKSTIARDNRASEANRRLVAYQYAARRRFMARDLGDTD
jgi:hypothetical protein